MGAFVWISILEGTLSIQDKPATRIDGKSSGLKIAEGVAFSPSGHCLAVAWAHDNAIALYKRIADSHYQTEPSCIICDPHLLGFAHDVAFSGCGHYLAVASRDVHRIVFYKMENPAECWIQSTPCFILETPSSYPSSVAFSPDGKLFAVCNRCGGHGVSLYRVHDEGIEKSPCLEITEEKLLEYNLSAPHGIAFLPDSKSVAVVHKQFYKTKDAKGNSDLSIIGLSTCHPSWVDYYADAVALHSIDCHPLDNSLLVVDEISKVSFYEKMGGNHFSQSHDFPISLQGGAAKGVRGVAFSADGKSMASASANPQSPFTSLI